MSDRPEITPLEAVRIPYLKGQAYRVEIDRQLHIATYELTYGAPNLLSITHLYETDDQGENPRAIKNESLIGEVATAIAHKISQKGVPVRADIP